MDPARLRARTVGAREGVVMMATRTTTVVEHQVGDRMFELGVVRQLAPFGLAHLQLDISSVDHYSSPVTTTNEQERSALPPSPQSWPILSELFRTELALSNARPASRLSYLQVVG